MNQKTNKPFSETHLTPSNRGDHKASETKRAAFSEVIDSSLHGFTAQSWQWDDFPAFGQLVTVQSGTRTLFGIVYQVHTGSMDPVRYPFPYQKTEAELLAEQPQIFEFLKTAADEPTSPAETNNKS